MYVRTGIYLYPATEVDQVVQFYNTISIGVVPSKILLCRSATGFVRDWCKIPTGTHPCNNG